MQACRLAVTNLSCRRGERLLFRGLSLAMEPGEALHIAGPNGIGKSSLLRILAGLLRPYSGTLEREGALGLMDERPALDGAMPLERALAFWADIDRAGDLEQIMEALDLTDLADVPVRFLSTGQRKRAAMARLIAQSAPIWLLDEPLSGLDEASRGRVDGLVGNHLAGGGIAVIASHQPFASAPMRTVHLAEFAR
ncbi:MAG: heme ABC exporter ATP-binding protein CcmA [Alteripontixanthobacter sp.]